MMDSTVQRNPRGWVWMGMVVAAILLALALGGCAARQPEATPTPTKTKMPTFTPAPPTATPTPPPPTATATLPPSPTPVPTDTVAPTATPEPPTPEPTPAPPTATPRPVAPKPAPKPVQPTAPPAPPPVADPCAGIGGDGCKWRVTGGPSFGQNGGLELKMQFIFLHSGIAGGQPQGDYRVVLFKGGQQVMGPENGRSIRLASSDGPKGKYNYEYTLGVDKLPDGKVAGSYSLYVQDGNGERDSEDIPFEVPANSGLVWIQFDQNR